MNSRVWSVVLVKVRVVAVVGRDQHEIVVAQVRGELGVVRVEASSARR